MTTPVILMIPWTSSKLVQPLYLSPHPSDSLSNALMQICCRKLVRKEEMEAHRLNGTWEIVKLPLGSVQLAPDGS